MSKIANAILAGILLLIVIVSCAHGQKGNYVIVEKNSIVFDRYHRNWSKSFQVTSAELLDCKTLYRAMAVKSQAKGKSFECEMYVNGIKRGQTSSSADDYWFIGQGGSVQPYLKIGTNTVEIKSVETEENSTLSGYVRGVAFYVSRTEGEDVDLIDIYPEKSAKSYSWVYGIIHCHTVASDGSKSIGERAALAQKLGYDFLIVTDHYEQINESLKSPAKFYNWASDPLSYCKGFSNYRESCDKYNKPGNFIMMAGAEVDVPWHAEPDTTDHSHILALGQIEETVKLDDLQGKFGLQEEAIAEIKANGWLPIAAHPAAISTKSATVRPWEWFRCRTDRRDSSYYQGIVGIERFNSITSAQEGEVESWQLDLVKKHYPAFVTSGCDSHGWTDAQDDERWQRITGIFVQAFDQEGIMSALKKGQTFASTKGAKILSAYPIPSFRPNKVKCSNFYFKLANVPVGTECVIYKEGCEAPGSRKKLGSDLKYQWEDNGAKGLNWYTFIVPGYIATSPLTVDVE